MVNTNPYLTLLDDDYYCLLPGHIYKHIPYINWVEDINWMIVYYDVYKAIMANKITDDQVKDWDLKDILDIIEVRV
jgi:hypothetical protein